MNTRIGLDRGISFIESHLHGDTHPHAQHYVSETKRDVVTISRQAGSGAAEIAAKLGELLQANEPQTTPPWTVFDRELVEKVLEQHHLPKELSKYMPENYINEFEGTLDELFGLHPASWILVRQTGETILRLATMGSVILIGRAANVITAKLPQAFHVRLAGSVEKRAARIQESQHLDRKEALAFISKADAGRRRYLKRYYKKDIDDPLLYHLVINTDLFNFNEAARLIFNAIVSRTHAIASHN
jgi:cytidylate kinase